MYDTIGERISYCRNLLGISRDELACSSKVASVATLARWELDYTEIPKLKLEKLIEFFQLNGIDVNIGWILFNNGRSPINTNLQKIDSLNFDELAYVTLSNLKSTIENFEICQINNNFFEPILRSGDYIGGISDNNIETLTNKLCYIEHDKMLSVGIFNFEQMGIVNFFKQIIKINNTTRIGAVSWIAKR